MVRVHVGVCHSAVAEGNCVAVRRGGKQPEENWSVRRMTNSIQRDVLAICRDVFETSLGWDDVFADNGGHSIVIA